MIRIHDQSVDHFTKTNDEAKSSESNLHQRVGFDSQNLSRALIIHTEEEEDYYQKIDD